MKKCTSCSKDLPDAALHCVFCGAKQASGPMPQQGLAKTVMGYSAQEMIQQIRQQGIPGGTPGAPPQATPPLGPPPGFAPAQAMSAAPHAPPPMPSAPAYNPAMAATIAPQQMNPQMAATMAPQQMQHANPQMAATIAPQQMSPFAAAPPSGNPGAVLGGGAGPAPYAPPHSAGPVGGGPVLGGGGVLTGSQPIVALPSDPPFTKAPARPLAAPAPIVRPSVSAGVGADALHGPVKAMMLVAGVLLVLFFIAPLSTDPLSFQFEQFKNVGDMAAKDMIGLFLVPVAGVLSIVLALVGMSTVVRGAIAAVLGLGGLGYLLYASGLFDHFMWQTLAILGGSVLTIAGLAIRSRYHSSLAARILATLGALAAIAVFVVPDDGKMLVGDMIDGITSGSTGALVGSIVLVLGLLTSVLGLLAWLPSGSAGAGALAVIALFVMIGGLIPGTAGFVFHFADALFGGVDGAAIGDQVSALVKQPAFGLLGWAPITAFVALAGWGLGGLVGRP